MEIGEPDFTAPAPVVEAGVRALRDGRTAYTATLGLPALREAIAGHYRDAIRREVAPEPHRDHLRRLGRAADRRRALCRRRRRDPGARSRLSRLPPLRARLRRRGEDPAGLGAERLPADARDGARGLGTAHQGPAARLAFEPHRHADLPSRNWKASRPSSPSAAASCWSTRSTRAWSTASSPGPRSACPARWC